MKKFIYTAAAMLVLAGSTASAITVPPTSIANKPKPQPTQPGPNTDNIPPTCPYNDPNGCGIFQ